MSSSDHTTIEQSFRSALQSSPHDPTIHHNLAVALAEQDRLDEAIPYFRQALKLRPDYPQAARNLSRALLKKKQYDEAIQLLWSVVLKSPHDPESLCSLASVMMEARQPEEALPLLQQAVRLVPFKAEIHNQLGLALNDCGRFDEAEQSYLEALKIDPSYAGTHSNLGALYKSVGRPKESLSCFELALALNPTSAQLRWNRALTLLALGRFKTGWEEYEWRWQRPGIPNRSFPKPAWNGEPVEGKLILLYAEQGLGDTVQFIRYASEIKKLGGSVLFECPSPLLHVLKSARGVDQIIPEGQPIPPFDMHAPLMSLPRILGTTLNNVPAKTPYISADASLIQAWHVKFQDLIKPGNKKIGIAWQGNPHHQWDRFRSCPLMALEPLCRIPNVSLISLQRGPGTEQIDTFQRLTQGRLVVPTSGEQTKPEHLAETAAIMMNLDLIISVDTATAHIAGALGRPAWVILSKVSDWRWLHDREDSPWYPTMRLFQQQEIGDWRSVIASLVPAIVST